MIAPIGRGSACKMMFKIISLFLIGIAVLAMFGKWRLTRTKQAARCPRCGAIMAGRGPCPCTKNV